MIWVSAKQTGNLHVINRITNKFVYLNILKNNLKVCIDMFRIFENVNFDQDNNPKYKFHLI